MKNTLSLCILVLIATVCEAQIYYVQDMSTTEIEALDRERTIVLLP